MVLERAEPRGEPQLGRRGLYETIGAGLPADRDAAREAMLWLLNAADGATSLLDVAERSSLPFAAIEDAAVVLRDAGLVRERSS